MTLARQASFDDLGTPLSEVTFCVLDIETTGGSAKTCQITEIGGAKYRMGEELASFQTLVDPGAAIPPSITFLTGITQTMVIEAPPIEAALPAFLEFISDAVIVGHNIRFDMSFLNAAAQRLGYPRLENRTLDTVALARRLVPKEVRNLRLATLANHFRSPVTPNHRALEDARATSFVLWGLLERAGSLGVTALDDLLQLPTARGSAHYRKIGLTDDLPRRPGVYMFRDRNGNVFYIGKANDLRSRVRSYFYGDHRRSVADMLRELDSVEHHVCQSPIDAEVTELRLIHQHRPRHNRRSKPPKANHFVKLTFGDFPRLSLVRSIRSEGECFLGPFRSRKSAELVMLAIWDAVPVRRCTNRPGSRPAPCPMAQMGVAMCPCDGALSPERYAPVAEAVRRGVRAEPEVLLGPLREKMARLASQQRYEDAATVRDRYRALSRALQRRRAWQALQNAGRIEARGSEGDSTVMDLGRLVRAWKSSQTPLIAAAEPLGPFPSVPPDVLAAEEAHLLWRWLNQPDVTLVECQGELSLPARQIEPL